MRITILNQAIQNSDNRAALRDTLAAMLRTIARDLEIGKDFNHITDAAGNIIGGYDIDGN
jgi:hypothetical protein